MLQFAVCDSVDKSRLGRVAAEHCQAGLSSMHFASLQLGEKPSIKKQPHNDGMS